MSETTVPYLCGGTFYILLLQALKKNRRIRINDLDGYAAKDNSINEVSCLKGLVRTFYDFNENYSESTFSGHKNEYKFCIENSTDWLRFETPSLVENYDAKVRQNYSEAMAAMDAFIDTFLDDGDLGEHLIRALLEVISQDISIKNEDRFVIDCSNREVDKKSLLEMKQINARQFILGVWHFIILKRGDKNKLGQDTVGVWLTHKTSQAPYKYVGTVGDKYASDTIISFEKVDFSVEAEYVDAEVYDDEDKDDSNREEKSKEKIVNQSLTAGVVFNQHAEKIVNINHVEHLEI